LTRLYSTAPVPAIAHRVLSPIGPVLSLGADWAELDQAEVLLVRGEQLQAADIARATSLRVIARTGSGVDKVDVEAATARGIPVLYAPSAGSRPVAEGAIALILAAMKRLGHLDSILREGDWPQRYEVDVRDVRDTVLGVVGFGQIGREVGAMAAALGMTVIAHDPALADGVDGVELLPLEALLARADVVTLHCPLTDSTRGLINEETLSLFKPGAILVNVARGEIVADDALLTDALDRGILSGVALDVFAHEPPTTSSPLLHDRRIVCTPHSIGLTSSWNELVFGSLAADIQSFLSGEQPAHVVDTSALAGMRQQL
jgi:phosphoglycerate dehydrogenase-like enzyme